MLKDPERRLLHVPQVLRGDTWVDLAPKTRDRDAATAATHEARGRGFTARVVTMPAPSGDHAELVRRVLADLLPEGLRARGLIQVGEETIRVATDWELDRMWGDEDWEPEAPHDTPRGNLGLCLEFRGYDVWAVLQLPRMRPWVADVTGGGRGFLRPVTDYDGADITGGRGVILRYLLHRGRRYEVYDRARPRGPRRFFLET